MRPKKACHSVGIRWVGYLYYDEAVQHVSVVPLRVRLGLLHAVFLLTALLANLMDVYVMVDREGFDAPV